MIAVGFSNEENWPRIMQAAHDMHAVLVAETRAGLPAKDAVAAVSFLNGIVLAAFYEDAADREAAMGFLAAEACRQGDLIASQIAAAVLAAAPAAGRA